MSPEPDPSVLAEKLLRPYLAALLSASSLTSDDVPLQNITPLFTSFYVQQPQQALTSPAETSLESIFITPSLPPDLPLPESPEVAANDAEAVFWAVMKHLRPQEAVDQGETSLWPPMDEEDE